METSVEHRNGRAGWARAGWTACVLGCMVPALLWGEESTPAERAFTSAQTVDGVIAGDTAVRIAVPRTRSSPLRARTPTRAAR